MTQIRRLGRLPAVRATLLVLLIALLTIGGLVLRSGHSPAYALAANTTGEATTTILIQRGDTLSTLAHRYHTSVADLQRLNGLGTSTRIYAGRHLRVPLPSTDTGEVTSVLAYARTQIGKPYRFGATGPDSFDCSGLTLRAWATAGVHLPRTAAEQAHAGTATSRAALRPGDLIVTNNFGHVVLYIGNGRVISAPHTGAFVHIGPLPSADQVDAYRHFEPIGRTS